MGGYEEVVRRFSGTGVFMGESGYKWGWWDGISGIIWGVGRSGIIINKFQALLKLVQIFLDHKYSFLQRSCYNGDYL